MGLLDYRRVPHTKDDTPEAIIGETFFGSYC